jgi:acetoin utilization deacetylase AcuC-like enzyme
MRPDAPQSAGHTPRPSNLDAVRLFYDPTCLEHEAGYGHPERPERLLAIVRELDAHGIPESELERPAPADLALVTEVHARDYVAALQRSALWGGGYWEPDTHIGARSFDAALSAAGGAVAAVDAAMAGARAAFSIARPPGHHALPDDALGFCLLNNVAIAAQHAVTQYGLERVLIVDWDVHHGNGTQAIFDERSDVLLYSTHQYPFYPGTGAAKEMGTGPGEGYTVNVPLPAGVGDAGYVRLFIETLVPLARRYRPELILISAGYDAHLADPLGGMAVTVAGFAELARIVRGLADELAEGRVAAVLEGGYDTDALAKSVLATIAMLGAGRSENVEWDAAPDGFREMPGSPEVGDVIALVKQIHHL